MDLMFVLFYIISDIYRKGFSFAKKITNDIYYVGIIKMMRMCVSVMVLYSAKAVSRGFPARVTWM